MLASFLFLLVSYSDPKLFPTFSLTFLRASIFEISSMPLWNEALQICTLKKSIRYGPSLFPLPMHPQGEGSRKSWQGLPTMPTCCQSPMELTPSLGLFPLSREMEERLAHQAHLPGRVQLPSSEPCTGPRWASQAGSSAWPWVSCVDTGETNHLSKPLCFHLNRGQQPCS